MYFMKTLLCAFCLFISAKGIAAEATADLGQDVIPGWAIGAQQTGVWTKDGVVSFAITVQDDAGGAPVARPISVRSGSPGLPSEAWGPKVSGTSGTPVTYAVTVKNAAHTAIYVTMVDAGGNTMTSHFMVVR